MIAKINSSQKGFTLIEILAVIFVIAVGMAGVFTLIQSTTSSARLVSYQLTGTYLAQEGVELVRSIRDTNWLENRAKSDDIPWDEDLAESLSNEEYQLDYTRLGQKPDWISYDDGGRLKMNNGSYTYNTSGDDTRFKRRITLERPSQDVIVVKVDVFFDFRGETRKVSSQEKLYNWRQ